MLKVVSLLLGVSFLLISISMVVAHPFLLEQVTPMIQGYQSRHTHSVDSGSIFDLANILLHSCIVITAGVGVFSLACLNDRFRKTAISTFPLLFLGLLLTALALIYTYSPKALAVSPFLYREDGFFETLTVIVFLVSAFFFGKAAWSVKAHSKVHTGKANKWILSVCVFCSIFSLVVAMEEASWGQRVFQWQTPESLVAINVQQETNFHNLLNEYFYFLYKCLVILPFAGLIPVVLSAFKRNNGFLYHLLPQIHLLGLSILIGILAIVMPYPPTELLEQLVALFTVSYSIQLAHTLRVSYPTLLQSERITLQ